MDRMSRKNTAPMCASAQDACFAAAVCLIMTGAISVVSVILLVGVLLLGVSILISVLEPFGRESATAA